MLDNILKSIRKRKLIIFYLIGIITFSILLFTETFICNTSNQNNRNTSIRLSLFNWEIDDQGSVNYVVDGDTFDVTNIGRIRLADINTPDRGETGFQEAREYVLSLILNHEVYLDIDDIYERDIYDRIVAVCYIRYNSSYLLNVNKILLETDYAEIMNYNNEFNPFEWDLYVYYTGNLIDDLLSIPSYELYVLFIIISFYVVYFSLYKNSELHTA